MKGVWEVEPRRGGHGGRTPGWLSFLLLGAALFAPPLAHAAEAETGGELPRLLVLDLLHRGTPPKIRTLVDEEVVAALRDSKRYHVMSIADVRTLLGLEAQRQLLGCERESCLTEIAGALGAEEIVAGTSLHIDRVTQVRLKRIDTANARVVRDVAVSASSVGELLELVRRAAFDLVEAPWQPRRRREVAWAEETIEVGAGLRFVSYPGDLSSVLEDPASDLVQDGTTTRTGPSLLLGYIFRSGDFAFGLRLATGVNETWVHWRDLFEPYVERVDLTTLRGGLLLRWPATGGVWVRPYLTAEAGVMRLRARSRGEDAPEWVPRTSGERYGPYLTAGVGLRFFPRARLGFALEGGLRLAPRIEGILDRDLPLADEAPPPREGAKERGDINGTFLLLTLRRAL